MPLGDLGKAPAQYTDPGRGDNDESASSNAVVWKWANLRAHANAAMSQKPDYVENGRRFTGWDKPSDR